MKKAMSLFLSVVVFAVVVASVMATPALAGYWDFQGNLPRPDGTRIYVKYTNVSPGQTQDVRMSWTVGTHCMRFLKITPDGHWHSNDICGTDPWCGSNAYDCSTGWLVDSIDDKFGCNNPPSLPTVWVNCRATNPL